MPDPVHHRTDVGILTTAVLLLGAGLLLFFFDDGGRGHALPAVERARAFLAGRPRSRLVALTLPSDGTLLDLARRGGLSLPGDGDVLVRWLDPLTHDTRLAAPFFGAGVDAITFVPDGGDAAWLWVSHAGLLSGAGQRLPKIGVGPKGEALTLALWMKAYALIRDDATNNAWSREERDAFVLEHRRQVGVSRLRLVPGDAPGHWRLDVDAAARRFDATPRTRLALDGERAGAVLSGLLGGGGRLTPWGTILVAEADDGANGFGEVEACWQEDGTLSFEEADGARFRPGAVIDPPTGEDVHAALGRVFEPEDRRSRDAWGWLVEIDPDLDETHSYAPDGSGHRKLGLLGRARWVGAAVATAADGALAPGRPIVVYAAERRQGGRLWKFVSSRPYVAGMDRAAVRALLGEGTRFVAHLEGDTASSATAAARAGRWVRLSLTSPDAVPDASPDAAANAASERAPTRTVGAALQDVDGNGLGGFADEQTLRRCLFTACRKIGVRGIGAPEDLVYSGGGGRLYVSMRASAGAEGGAILALRETGGEDPASSRTLALETVWQGPRPPAAGARPVDLLLAGDGGTLCFTADGGCYVLDLEASSPTRGRALLLVAAPAGIRLRAPCVTPEGRTLFLGVHPDLE